MSKVTEVSKVTVDNKRIFASIKASMGFEGLKPSAYAEKACQEYLAGKKSSAEALAQIKAKHAPNFGKQ